MSRISKQKKKNGKMRKKIHKTSARCSCEVGYCFPTIWKHLNKMEMKGNTKNAFVQSLWQAIRRWR